MEWKTLFFPFSEAIVSFSEAFFQELSHFGLLNLSLIRGFISLVKKEFFFRSLKPLLGVPNPWADPDLM